MNASDRQPDGRTVNRVEFGNDHARLGTFRQVDRRHWVEDSVVDGPGRFEYVEVRRDDRTVELLDHDRDIRIIIDPIALVVRRGSGGGSPAPIGTISAATAHAHGWTVNRVEFGHGGVATGVLRRIGDREWVEDGVDGASDLFRFDEQRRDDWSVILRDDTRDIELQIDLHQRGIKLRSESGDGWLYDVLDATDDVTGWLVDLVEIGSGTTATGLLRQVDTDVWIETTIDADIERFRFDVVERLDCSVRLHDPSRDVMLVIDLAARRVLYGPGQTATIPIYDVVAATDDAWVTPPRPEPAPLDTARINRVEFGPRRDVAGVLRQIDRVTWVEQDADGNDRFRFEEIARDAAAIRLYDRGRDISLEIDVAGGRIRVGEGSTVRRRLANVLDASSEVSGELVSGFEFDDAGRVTFEQVDWTTWYEVRDSATHAWAEINRTAWSLDLVDPERSAALHVDLYAHRVTLGTASGERVVPLASTVAGEGVWRHGEQLSCVCRLAVSDEPSDTGELVFRTSISVSPATRWVSIRASEEVEIRIGDRAHVVDRVRSVTVEPSRLATVVVRCPARALWTPSLHVRTNLMPPDVWHTIRADEDVVRKLSSCRPDFLRAILRQNGRLEQIGDAIAAGAGRALTQLARLMSASSVPVASGVELRRDFDPSKLAAQAFEIVFTDVTHTFGTLSLEEAGRRVAAAVAAQAPVGQALELGTALLTGFTVATNTGRGLVSAAGRGVARVRDDAHRVIDPVARDVVRDIIAGHPSALPPIPGMPKIPIPSPSPPPRPGGPDVTVIVHTDGGDTRVDLSNPDQVLRVMQTTLNRFGIAFDDVGRDIADAFDWDPIFETHDALVDLFDRGYRDVGGFIETARRRFATASGLLGMALDGAPSSMTAPLPKPTKQSADAMKGVVDKLTWFFDQVVGGATEVVALGADAAESAKVGLIGYANWVGDVPNNMAAGLVAAVRAANGNVAHPRPPVAMPARMSRAAQADPLEQLGSAILVGLPTTAPAGLGRAFAGVGDTIDRHGAEVGDAIGRLISTVTGQIASSTPNPEQIARDLIAVLGDVGNAIDRVLVAVVEAVLGVGGAALNVAHSAAKNSLPTIPFLTGEYRRRRPQQELTLLRLIALAVAIPVTSAYRLDTGSRRPPARIGALADQTPTVKLVGYTYSGIKLVRAICAFDSGLASKKLTETSASRKVKALLLVCDATLGVMELALGNPIPPGATARERSLVVPPTNSHEWAVMSWTLQIVASPALPTLELVASLLNWNLGFAQAEARVAMVVQRARVSFRPIYPPLDVLFAVLSAVAGTAVIASLIGIAVNDDVEGKRLDRLRPWGSPPIDGTARRTQTEEQFHAWWKVLGPWAKVLGGIAGTASAFAPLVALPNPAAGAALAIGSNLTEGFVHGARTASNALY